MRPFLAWLAAAVALMSLPGAASPAPGPARPAVAQEQEPPTEPPLPAGLGTDGREDEPDDEPDTADAPRPAWRDHLTGFIDVRGGLRLRDDPLQKTAALGEVRLQLDGEWEAGPAAVFRGVADLLYDPVGAEHAVDLETGDGVLDLREANAVLRPFRALDIKAGRQILTWGTGDLLFLNDLFPKDFRAFFIGRDEEYLKAPSDAVRMSLFTAAVNIDLVYTPRFDADRFIDGSRLSFFDPATGRLAGRDARLVPVRPDAWFQSDEIAARVHRQIGGYEAAAYAYDGFWKSPVGAQPNGTPFFPELSVYGASLRGPFAGGIGNVELAFYDGQGDEGSARPGNQLRVLAGLEREALPELTVGVQYYVERQTGAAHEPPSPGAAGAGRTRHLLTLRVSKLALRQTVTASLFTFWSPDDEDGHGRVRIGYKVTDAWLVEGGLNVFWGPRERPFGQLRDSTNVFAGVRRSF